MTYNNRSPYGIAIFKNISSNGSISFTPAINFGNGIISSPTQLVVCDLDMDGRPDIFGPTGYGIQIFQSTDTANKISFSLLSRYLLGTIDGECAASDIDGDGKPDIIVSTTSGIYVYMNTSNGGKIQFASAVFFP